MEKLEDLVGETLVFGVPGTRLRPADVRLFRETRAGGLILYRINFESPAQVRRLVRGLEEALGRRLLVTVDHEGGRVIMFRDGVTVFPDNLALGAGGTEEDARRQGAIEARELRRLGMDVDFSPTVDVLTDGYSPNIGIRSYGADPRRVAALAAARIRAMQKNGLSACAKHFPGLGPASLDPHLDLPVIPLTWRGMRKDHLLPFLAAMEAGVDVVMSSHPLYPRLDPEPRAPATFSRRLIRGLLREELGYRGVISSDDLEMGALRNLGTAGRAAVRTAGAGHDLLLCCHREDMQRDAQRSLLEAYRTGELSTADLEESVERIRKLRAKRDRRFEDGAPRAEKEGAALAASLARRGLRAAFGRSARRLGALLRGGIDPSAERRLALYRRSGSVAVIFPRVSDLARRIMIERPLEDEAGFLRRELGRVPARKDIRIVPINPGPREIAAAAKAARNAETAVLFCFDAHIHPGGRRLLQALQKASPRLVLVLMQDPYDAAWARPGDVVVTAFGSRVCQVRACLETVFG